VVVEGLAALGWTAEDGCPHMNLLECGYEAEGVLAAGAEGVAGEKASEVDQFEGVA